MSTALTLGQVPLFNSNLQQGTYPSPEDFSADEPLAAERFNEFSQESKSSFFTKEVSAYDELPETTILPRFSSNKGSGSDLTFNTASIAPTSTVELPYPLAANPPSVTQTTIIDRATVSSNSVSSNSELSSSQHPATGTIELAAPRDSSSMRAVPTPPFNHFEPEPSQERLQKSYNQQPENYPLPGSYGIGGFDRRLLRLPLRLLRNSKTHLTNL